MRESLGQQGEQVGATRLSARKRAILRSVIDHYVSEVRPVSSQAVAEGLGFSSATARNELSALEEQGFLRQLHTSGGRVPTDMAYRFFVEEMLNHLSHSLEQRTRVQSVYRQIGREIETLLEGTVDLLSSMTGQVAWVSLPETSALNVKSINFVEVDQTHVLIVLVTGDGSLQSRMATVELPVAQLETGRLAELLNNYLRGRSILEVDYSELQSILRQATDVPESMIRSISEFFSSLSGKRERVVFGNALRLVLEPEFTGRESINRVLSGIENKEAFVQVLRRQLTGEAMDTIIGSENSDSRLHECSLIVSRLDLGGGRDGTLGVLGPTRQHYDRTMSWVKLVGEAVARTVEELEGGGGQG
jgi:heat-inducible transcriptional repressor